MDLTLRTTDSAGGEVSVDKAFSLYFLSEGTMGWDRYDASKLLPRGDRWAAIAFEGVKDGEEVLKAQESRPYSDSLQVVDVKLIKKNMPAATYTISVETWYSVPSNWSLRLRSEALGKTFVIDDPSDTISFELEASSSSEEEASKSAPSAQKTTSDTTHIALAGEVGPADSSLPVELSSFSVNSTRDQAVLRWRTMSETNNSGFAIQHQEVHNADAKDQWSKIGFVNGKGTTNEPQTYRFMTSSLNSGTHIFRLKQIDQDGATHYSEPVRLVRKPSGPVDLTTAPNPFAEQMTITLTPRAAQSVTIQLVDMLGRVVKEIGPVDVSAGAQTQMRMAGNRLSSGSYLLRVDGETFTETERVVRMR
ncbi:hypothetical protein BSZ35_00345 [Salinibacter sp. 10B]|nr:hypothetical protein BSZ35_00345 [Salinibacter sp. 10B]